MNQKAESRPEATMGTSQELAVKEKREVAAKEENTVPGRFFVPATDIYETDEGLTLVMEMPGVSRDNVEIALENDTLRVEGRIDFANYEGLEPIYTEYNVGHYARSFVLSNKVAQDGISAQLEDGVLKLTLPKTAEARVRRIAIT